jgi:integrase/recombinase XerC
MRMEEAMADFLRFVTVERNLAASTVRAYRKDLGQLLAFVRGRLGRERPDLADLSPHLLREHAAQLHELGLAPASTAGHLAAVRSCCRWLYARGLLASNPAQGLRNPKQEQRLPHVLSEAEVEELLAAPDAETPSGRRGRAILEVLYGAGLRVGELVGLNLEDVDLGAGVARVRGKGNRERLAAVGPPAVAALRLYLSQRAELGGPDAAGQQALFVNYRGGRLTARSVGRLLESYLASAGLDPRTHPHTLRHSFATHLIDNGADIRSVMDLAGHRSIRSTAAYVHISTQKLREQYDRARSRASSAGGASGNSNGSSREGQHG